MTSGQIVGKMDTQKQLNVPLESTPQNKHAPESKRHCGNGAAASSPANLAAAKNMKHRIRSNVEEAILQKHRESGNLQHASDQHADERIRTIVVENFPNLGKMSAFRFVEWVVQNPCGVCALPTSGVAFCRKIGFVVEIFH
jgi:hypothetical protein